MLFYTHKHVSGGNVSIGKAIFAMARHSSVEWVNGQEGNTRWGGIIRKNLSRKLSLKSDVTDIPSDKKNYGLAGAHC
ncbi:hypothetical protein ACLB1E_03620 [Escherichia coli]